MYRVYTTQALVVGAYDRMTADRTVQLFTRDAGMLYAMTKSVREERSKQRYGLTEFSLLTVSLVRGKAGWRITGVLPAGNIFTSLQTREQRAYIRNTIRFLKRMVRGEAPSAVLFDMLVEALARGVDEQKPERLERELIHRMCTALGYLPHKNLTELTDEHLDVDIARAIKESHL